ncbi:MAG: hypothetical protein K0V04_39515 [Deltaproteobacteria bacterium]|nr:hypothetical protein [Deltaproteobacteria bacterium]
MRPLVWLVVVVSGVGCAKRGPAPVVPDSSAAPPSAVTPPAATLPPSPSEVLSKAHGAAVSIDQSLPLPKGFVVGYTYDLAEATIGEMTAKGIDVQMKIDAAEAECQAELDAMPEDEREYYEMEEGRSCSEMAIGDVLGDDTLSLECAEAGLAYFDLDGKLLVDESIGIGCTGGFTAFDVRHLGPNADATLWVTLNSHGDAGYFDRGGWGFRTEDEHLYVLEIPEGSDDGGFLTTARLPLDQYEEGGNCGGGSHGGVELHDSGAVMDHFEQDYNECDDEGCVMPDDVEYYREEAELAPDEPLEMDLCPVHEVSAVRYVWNTETGEWDDGEWDGEVPTEMPTDLDY